MDASVIAAAQFDPVDEAGWRKLAEKALKGADFDATLTTGTDDGLIYGPIYPRRGDAAAIARAEPDRPWRIVQRLDDEDIGRAARQAGDDLANGADALSLVMAGTPGACGFGLAEPAGPTLRRLVDALDMAGASIRLEGSAVAARALADALIAARAGSSSDKAPAEVHFGIDPVSAAAASAQNFAVDGHIADIALALKDFGLAGTVLKADGRVAHNAGASEAQELAFVLAALAALARAAEAGGMPLEDALAATALGVSVDQQQFVSIAKLRALRLLHARVSRACGVEAAAPARIHAETSYRMLTRRDPETNILRNTIAAFAAGVGGADSIAVLPHTLALGLPDAFARRVARNTQVVLVHESHLDFVADPAAGSGGIEALTEALCAAAWKEFQAIEGEGGIMASLSAGAFQRRVAAARKARDAAIADGSHPIVGATLHPAGAERPVSLLARRERKPARRGSGRALEAITLEDASQGAEE